MIERRRLLTGMIGLPLLGAEDESDDAKTFVVSVLKLFDDGEYEEIYKSKMGAAMQGHMTLENWIAAARKTSEQAGKVVSRSLSKTSQSMGIYRFVFDTKRSEGNVFEDLSATLEDEQWKLAGFWMRPNLA